MRAIFILLLFTVQNSFSQSLFLDYKPLRSKNFIGKAVIGYSNFELPDAPLGANIDPAFINLDSSGGADYATEYTQEMKKLTLPFFSNSDFRHDSIWAKNPVYWSLRLDENSVEKMKMSQNFWYIYSGLTADSVVMRVKFSKHKYLDFKKAIEALTKVVQPAFHASTAVRIAVDSVLTGVASLGDANSRKDDTAYLYFVVSDPNVLYKVQGIKVYESSNIGNKYTQNILPGGKAGRNLIDNDFYNPPLGKTSSISILIPYSRASLNAYSISKPAVRFNAKEENGKVIPYLTYTSPKITRTGVDTIYFNAKQTTDGGKVISYWEGSGMLGEYLAPTKIKSNGSFRQNGYLIKKVYYNLMAMPVENSNTGKVRLVHYNQGANKTYLRYPEIAVEYLK